MSTELSPITPDPELDLVIERTVPVPVELVWRAWTEPELLKQWFCPKPWQVTECEIDLRPGGRFYTFMKGPEEGQAFPNEGCYLEVHHERRLVFTDSLAPGYRPKAESFMTAFVEMSPTEDGGTRYVAIARHGSPETVKQHEEMGFFEGWNTTIDQMVALMQGQ